MQRHVVRNLTILFRFCSHDGRRKRCRGFHYDTSAGDNGPPAGGKRRLIREGGPASQIRDHVRPLDPGGGAVSTVSPQRMRTDDVFQTVEQSGGGSLVISPRSVGGMY